MIGVEMCELICLSLKSQCRHNGYRYDDAGNRTVKLSGNGNAVFVCASDSSNGFTQTDRFTAYPNPYMVYNGSRYYKHIYIGSDRIVSKVSVNNPYYDPRQEACAGNTISGYEVKLRSQQQALSDSIASIYSKFEVPYYPNNNDDYSYNWSDGRRRSVSNPDSYGELAYFYHSDHLGSTLYVTTGNGDRDDYQQVEYTPFGEVFFEVRNNTWNTPYLFNAKELDEETGLYYYGARYYDPRTSLWLSTDPMELKYPNISSYCYTTNNPINAVDPNGGVVIFINGMHFGDGGKAEYWNGLDNRIMNKIGDKKSLYYDGAIGGYKGVFSKNTNLSAENRFNAGKAIGILNAKSILSNLSGNESIKLVSHSMGAAYTKGFIAGLKEYAIKNKIDISNLIEMEIDLAPFQPNSQKAYKDINTIVIQHALDGVAGIGKMQDAKQRYVTREDTYITDKNALNVFLKEHSVDSFTQDEINKYVPSSNRNAE